MPRRLLVAVPRRSARWLLGLSLAMGLGLAQAQDAPLPAGETPGLAGPPAQSYQVQDLDWRDAARQRAVPVRLYWPAEPKPGAAVPLILFSHGIGGSRQGYSYLGAFWASQGWASLHVQHVGSDRSLWWGNPLALVERLQGAAQEREAVNRARDISFALDQLLQGERGAAVDATRIVAAGHSYGANTSLLLSGARVARQGQALDLRDPRIKAAIIISAPPFYGEGDPAPILRPIAIPTLHITATEDVIRIPGYYSAASDRQAVFEATGSPAKALAVFSGGSHSIFTDRAGTGGAELNPRVKAATRELTLAFLEQVLGGRGDAAALQHWSERYRGLLARWVQPAP